MDMNEPKAAPSSNQWKTLKRDLGHWAVLEGGTAAVRRSHISIMVAGVFVLLCAVAVMLTAGGGGRWTIGLAALLGAYMALNIGANDVANNLGPAVGAKALTMGSALIIAAICETAGALLAGGDVVATISGGIVAPAAMADPAIFVRAMLAALVSASIWLNLATWLGAPVSTTHAIVGGVAGAGAMAAGLGAINWPTLERIALSWVISPVMGGVIAAALLGLVRAGVVERAAPLVAARRWIPALVGIMAGTFASYLLMKGLDRVMPMSLPRALGAGLVIGVACWLGARPVIRRRVARMDDPKRGMQRLFAMPLVCAAALLSFAHGANDVANAISPLAAIVHAIDTANGAVAGAVHVPLWTLLIGAFGISFGLLLFGPRLIRMVGDEITRLNALRAWCVALAAGVTVIVASGLGLPVSSTHIAVGGIFGVGFYREWNVGRRLHRDARRNGNGGAPARAPRRLVRRGHVLGIAAAWVVTVPMTAALSAGVFRLLELF